MRWHTVCVILPDRTVSRKDYNEDNVYKNSLPNRKDDRGFLTLQKGEFDGGEIMECNNCAAIIRIDDLYMLVLNGKLGGYEQRHCKRFTDMIGELPLPVLEVGSRPLFYMVLYRSRDRNWFDNAENLIKKANRVGCEAMRLMQNPTE